MIDGRQKIRLTQELHLIMGYTQYSSRQFLLAKTPWFVRLQNLSLAYHLPSKWLGKIVNTAIIRLDAQNLFLITPFDGVDPETVGYDSRLEGTDLDPSNLVAAYPNVKTYTIGIDIKF